MSRSLNIGTLTRLSLCLFVLLFSACSNDKDSDPEPSTTYPRNVKIEYRVTSSTGITGFGNVSYTNETDGDSKIDNGSLPFSKTINRSVKEDTRIDLYMNLFDSSAGSVTAEILVDGKVVITKTNTSTGNYPFNISVAYYFR